MWDQRLNELIFLLALVSLASWTIVGITTLVRTAAQIRYRQRARIQMQRQAEEATE
ncbi:hypothetical protein IRY61_03815 [Candidatus Saccharibacteria bacterium]|nr:hypothetical protein [Candidatus Saccharibacteria bacterium]